MDVLVPLRHAESEVAERVRADVDAPGKQAVALLRRERPIVPDDVADRISHPRAYPSSRTSLGVQRVLEVELEGLAETAQGLLNALTLARDLDLEAAGDVPGRLVSHGSGDSHAQESTAA